MNNKMIFLIKFTILYTIFFYMISPDIKAQSAIELKNQGDNYYQNKQYYEALNKYNEALKKNRNYREIRLKIGKTYEKLGKQNLALEMYTNSTRIDKNFIDIFFAAGDLFIKLKKPEKAYKYYEHAFKTDPKNIKSILKMAALMYELDDLNNANIHLNQVLKIDPSNNNAFLYKGLIEIKKNNLKKADSYLLKAKKNNYNDSKVYHNLAILKHKENNLTGAIENIERAIQIAPDDQNVIVTGARIYIDAKKWDKCINSIDNIIKSKGDIKNFQNYINYYNLGIAYKMNSDNKSAITAFQKAISINDGDDLTRLYLKKMLINNMGYYSPERIIFSKKHLNKFNYFRNENDVPLALFHIRMGIKLNGDNYSARADLGYLYMDNGFLEKGIRELEIANKLNPSDYKISDKLEFKKRDSKQLLSNKLNINQYNIRKNKVEILIPDFDDQKYYGHLDAGKTCSFIINHFLEQSSTIKPVRLKNVNSKNISKIKSVCDSKKIKYYITGNCIDNYEKIIINIELNDINLNKTIYNEKIIRYGNNKLIDSGYKFYKDMEKLIDPKGEVIKILDTEIIVNLGLQENITNNTIITITKNNQEIGKAKITEIDEQLSKAVPEDPGLFKRVIIGSGVYIK